MYLLEENIKSKDVIGNLKTQINLLEGKYKIIQIFIDFNKKLENLNLKDVSRSFIFQKDHIKANIDETNSARKIDFKHVTVKNLDSNYVLIAFNDGEQTTLVGQPTIGQQATIKEEIIDLFNFFHEKKVFIIDRPIIKELYDILEEYNNRIVNDVTGLLDHNKINKIESQKYLLKKINNFSTSFENDKIHINFGICMMDFETFYTVSNN
jgi:hypothetical protein